MSDRFDYTKLRRGARDPLRHRKIVMCPTCGEKGAYSPSVVPQTNRARGSRMLARIVHVEDYYVDLFTMPMRECTIDVQQENAVRADLGLGPVELGEAEVGRVRFRWTNDEFNLLRELGLNRPVLLPLWNEGEAGALLAGVLLDAFKISRGNRRKTILGIVARMGEAFGPAFAGQYCHPFEIRRRKDGKR